MPETQAPPGVSADHVGDVGEKPTEFISLKTGDVGEALSLFKQLGGREERGAPNGHGGGVNKGPISPTSPTSQPENGGNAGVSAPTGHVGNVGDVGATYMPGDRPPPENHVGDAGGKRTESISPGSRRRIVL
jgi:hypothetical protein